MNKPMGIDRFARRMLLIMRLKRLRADSPIMIRDKIDEIVSSLIERLKSCPDYWANVRAFFPHVQKPKIPSELL